MADNKIYTKPTYKCAVCGEIYESVQDRMNCEMTCIKQQQEAEKKEAAARLQAAKDECFAEASAALDNALALVNKCIENYGTFQYTGKLKDNDLLNMDFFPSKLWHHFWF